MIKHLKKVILTVLVLQMLLVLLSGCRKSNEDVELEFWGGDIPRYSLCIEENKENGFSCPVIMNKRVKSITFNGFVSDNNELISVEADIDVDDYKVYNGYYIYYVLLDVMCESYDEAIDVNINKLFLEIDGQLVEYVTPYINIKNTTYYCENKNCQVEDNAIFISGGFTGIYGYVPNEKRRLDLMVSGNKDMKIKSYELTDYLEIKDLEANGNRIDSNNIDIDAKKDQDIDFEYLLNFKENVFEDNIIRVSQVIIYEHDGQDYLWVYTPGVYIWKDYMDYGNIKRYIDAL